MQITPRIIKDGDSGIEQRLYHELTEKELIDFNIDDGVMKKLEAIEHKVENAIKE